jgi:hypothetical protein
MTGDHSEEPERLMITLENLRIHREADSRQRRPFSPLWVGLRLTAAAVILFGPIATASWAMYAPAQVGAGYVEVDPSSAGGPSAEGVREYLAARDPVVDRLLPNGAGGTRFFEDLDGNAGMVFDALPAVGIAADVDNSGWPEATELHERAHLLYTFLPDEVSRLMARLPVPMPGEYAATNANEHLAEMASSAWEIVALPKMFCPVETPVERLHDAEMRVPGTAGFVIWYLRHVPREGVEGYDELSHTAAALAAAYRSESEALWMAVEDRRLPGGELRHWSYRSVRDYLAGQRAVARASGDWLGRIASYSLTPSLIVLSLVGR